MASKPRVIVFDLDYTLWPFYVECEVTAPFRRNSNGSIIDESHNTIDCFPDVPAVLSELYSSGYQLAVASRTGDIDGANSLINLFGWDKYFIVKEIYPGCKIEHFTRISEKTGVQLKDMMFFDDEPRNITDLESKGVTCILVTNGVTEAIVNDSLKNFKAKKLMYNT